VEEAGGRQRGDAGDQQAVEKVRVTRPKQRQGRVVGGEAATEPHIGRIAVAAAIALAGGANGRTGREELEREEHRRVRRRRPRASLDRADLLVQLAQVNLLDDAPAGPGEVVGRHKLFEIEGAEVQRVAVGAAEAGARVPMGRSPVPGLRGRFAYRP
jgi:hypothetical protein